MKGKSLRPPDAAAHTMAIYRLEAGLFTRSAGHNALAAMAYRAGCKLTDERTGQSWDYTRRKGVLHAEILAPDDAPAWVFDRATLWNRVEAREDHSTRASSAQLARNIELALPHELTHEQRVALVRDFVGAEMTSRGMVVDIAFHAPDRRGDSRNYHAHLAVSLRALTAEGFGKKVREWNALFADEKAFKGGKLIAAENFKGVRARWAEHVNRALADAGLDARVDHRSYQEQGIDLEPEPKLGPFVVQQERMGHTTERGDEWRAVKERNAVRLEIADALAEAKAVLEALTHHHSTFTLRDLARAVHARTENRTDFDAVMIQAQASPDLLRVGTDDAGRDRFTTQTLRQTEERMIETAAALAARTERHATNDWIVASVAARTGLSTEQTDAVTHITDTNALACMTGYAGAGKSRTLGAAREVWESCGFTVHGLALSGIAAEGLEEGAGIASKTIASQLHRWAAGRDALTARDVVVLDEAGMVDSRTMDQLLTAVHQAGAKIVLVGDTEQLQAIQAGAAFRAIIDRHGAAELREVRRQSVDWQKEATRELAEGATEHAFRRYEDAGSVTAHATEKAAIAAIVQDWTADRAARPDGSRMILAPTRDLVAALNDAARHALREGGGLGQDAIIQTADGPALFAPGDRLMFRKNNRTLEVKNGTLGNITAIDGAVLTVKLDNGRNVTVDSAIYNNISLGYAATIHKTQGVTVDRTFVLAAPNLDRHGTYVALSRHTEDVRFYFSTECFPQRADLIRTIARERLKDTSLDYDRAAAPEHGREHAEKERHIRFRAAAHVLTADAGSTNQGLPNTRVIPDPTPALSPPPWESARHRPAPNRYRTVETSVTAALPPVTSDAATRQPQVPIPTLAVPPPTAPVRPAPYMRATPTLDRLFPPASSATAPPSAVAQAVTMAAVRTRDAATVLTVGVGAGIAKRIGTRILDRLFGESGPRVPLTPEQARVARQRRVEEDNHFQPKEELHRHRESNVGKWYHWQRGRGGIER